MLNFTISEFLISNVAKKNNILNIPNSKQLDNILYLIFYCLQPARNLIRKPIIITSGFRCRELNDFVGGSKNSNHLSGCAADFVVKTLSPAEIIEIISSSNIPFNELINEYDKWVHISYLKHNNKRKIITIR